MLRDRPDRALPLQMSSPNNKDIRSFADMCLQELSHTWASNPHYYFLWQSKAKLDLWTLTLNRLAAYAFPVQTHMVFLS